MGVFNYISRLYIFMAVRFYVKIICWNPTVAIISVWKKNQKFSHKKKKNDDEWATLKKMNGYLKK